MNFFSDDPKEQAGIMLAFCAIALYVSGRVLTATLTARSDDVWKRAVGQWLPIAVTTLAAVLLGEPAAAMGVIFATSVGSLSLVVGVIAMYRSAHPDDLPPPRWSLFIVPACLLAWLVGFRTHLSEIIALLLLAQGLMIWWTGRGGGGSVPSAESEQTPPEATGFRTLEIVLAIALAGVGAWAGLRGSQGWTSGRAMPVSLFAATFLGPVLLLPAIGASPVLAQRGRTNEAVSQQVLVVLLNLLLLLPLSTFAWQGTQAIAQRISASKIIPTPPTTTPATTQAVGQLGLLSADSVTQTGLPYPPSVWRVDALLLVLLSVAIVPILLGRWKLGGVEAFLLLTLYVAYVGFTAVSSIR